MHIGDYMYSLTNQQRLAVLSNLSPYGDPHLLLDKMFQTVPCYQDKKYEVYIFETFIFYLEKKTFSASYRGYIVDLRDVRYCYHSRCSDGSGTLGLIKEDSTHREIGRLPSEVTAAIFHRLTHINGFDQISPHIPPYEVRYPYPFHPNSYYAFRQNAIVLVKPGMFGKINETLQIADINQLCWCAQTDYTDSEAADSYSLSAYYQTGKRACELEAPSIYEAYRLAMELKRRVPHLTYRCSIN